MNIKDKIIAGVITGTILGLGSTIFMFQARLSKLEVKYNKDEKTATKLGDKFEEHISIINVSPTISKDFSHKKINESPTVNQQIHNKSSRSINVNSSIATGTTNLTSEECGIQAKKAFHQVEFSNISMAISLQDNKVNYSPNINSPRSVDATNNGNKYSIFCKPFGSKIVIFSYAGTGKNKMKSVWDAFYK